jgi:hypothetical protein
MTEGRAPMVVKIENEGLQAALKALGELGIYGNAAAAAEALISIGWREIMKDRHLREALLPRLPADIQEAIRTAPKHQQTLAKPDRS